jgi:hypothetical protein
VRAHREAAVHADRLQAAGGSAAAALALGRATDNAGNTTTSALFALKVDLDMPVTTATLTPGSTGGTPRRR